MKNRLQCAAIFMICLILGIPVYSAVTYADMTAYTINKNGVMNYRNSVNDKTVIVANISDSGITSDKVTLRSTGSKSAQFQSCVPDGSRSICKYEFTGDWSGAKRDFFASYGSLVAPASIIVDSLAPNVTINSIAITSQIIPTITVNERAYDANDNTVCSGIQKIVFKLTSQAVQTTYLNFTPGTNCDYSTTVNVDAPSTGKLNKTFCIDVYDNVGNVGEQCQQIIFDKEPAQASNLRLIDISGKTIDYIAAKTGPISAAAAFDLDEQSIVQAYADASDFSIYDLQKQQMSHIPLSCTPAACRGQCSCSVPITLNLPEGGNPILRITVADSAGIQSNISLPVAVRADNTAPKLMSISGNDCGQNNAVGKTANTITATIQEADSGLHGKKVYLDLSSVLGSGYNAVYPNECTSSGSTWTCTWGLFNTQTTPPKNPSIQVLGTSQDDAGNFLDTSGISGNFVYVDSTPEFSNYSIFAATRGEIAQYLTGYPVSGGTIQLTVTAKHELPLTATADFSNVAYAGKRTAQCTQSGNDQTCTFSEVGPLFNGPMESFIPVTLSDCVGNVNETDIPMNISAIGTEQQDYWSYIVGDAMPSYIDRSTLDVFAHADYFKLTLNPSRTDVSPISQQIISCNGTTDYLDSNLQGRSLPDLLGAPSSEVYAKFTIQRGVEPPDSLSYTCVMKTISRTNQGIISPAEYDNLTFTIKFQNSPYGTIDSALKTKVDNVKNSSLVQGKWINAVQSIFDVVDRACTTWKSVVSAYNVITLIYTAVSTLQFTPAALVPKAAKATTAATGSSVYGVLGPIVSTTCDFVTCDVPIVQNTVTDAIKAYLELGKNSGIAKAFNINVDVNPKTSILTSILTLCIPGVLYNLQKARQIECTYITCVNNQVAEGVSPVFCDVQRYSGWCMYVVGAIYSVVPFGTLLNNLGSTISNLLSNPVTVIAAALSLVCLPNPEDTTSALCFWFNNLSNLYNILQKLGNLDYWKNLITPSTTDACEAVVGKFA